MPTAFVYSLSGSPNIVIPAAVAPVISPQAETTCGSLTLMQSISSMPFEKIYQQSR